MKRRHDDVIPQLYSVIRSVGVWLYMGIVFITYTGKSGSGVYSELETIDKYSSTESCTYIGWLNRTVVCTCEPQVIYNMSVTNDYMQSIINYV